MCKWTMYRGPKERKKGQSLEPQSSMDVSTFSSVTILSLRGDNKMQACNYQLLRHVKFWCTFATTGINDGLTSGYLLYWPVELGRRLDVCLFASVEVNASLVELIQSEMLEDGTHLQYLQYQLTPDFWALLLSPGFPYSQCLLTRRSSNPLT